MKRLTLLLTSAVLLILAIAPAARAEFGLTNFSFGFTNKDGSAATQAGSHPFAVITTFDANTKIDPESAKVIPDGDVKALRFQLPPGFVGSATAVQRCSSADFLAVDELGYPACPDATAVGVTQTRSLNVSQFYNSPVYNLVPPPGVAAKIGFIVYSVPVTVEIGINERAPSNITAGLLNVPQVVEFFGSSTELWGIPADHAHDAFRGRCIATGFVFSVGEQHSKGICDTGSAEVPFLTLPRSCTRAAHGQL